MLLLTAVHAEESEVVPYWNGGAISRLSDKQTEWLKGNVCRLLREGKNAGGIVVGKWQQSEALHIGIGAGSKASGNYVYPDTYSVDINGGVTLSDKELSFSYTPDSGTFDVIYMVFQGDEIYKESGFDDFQVNGCEPYTYNLPSGYNSNDLRNVLTLVKQTYGSNYENLDIGVFAVNASVARVYKSPSEQFSWVNDGLVAFRLGDLSIDSSGMFNFTLPYPSYAVTNFNSINVINTFPKDSWTTISDTIYMGLEYRSLVNWTSLKYGANYFSAFYSKDYPNAFADYQDMSGRLVYIHAPSLGIESDISSSDDQYQGQIDINQSIQNQINQNQQHHDEIMDTDDGGGVASEGNEIFDKADKKFSSIFYPIEWTIETAQMLVNVPAMSGLMIPAIFNSSESFVIDFSILEKRVPALMTFIRSVVLVYVAWVVVMGVYRLITGEK